MAIAPIKCELPTVFGATGLTLKLFAHPGTQNAASVAGPASLTVDTALANVYWTTLDATTLAGVYAVQILSGSNTVGTGYIFMTNTTDVHVVQSDPWIGNADGTRVKIEAGGSKNKALDNFPFTMFSVVSGLPLPGLTVTAERSIDGGSFALCTNAPVEIGGGDYSLDMSAADRNGNTVMFRFTATGAREQRVGMVLS